MINVQKFYLRYTRFPNQSKKHMRITSVENTKVECMVFVQGWCVWITGLPGSGKSVVSQALLMLFAEKSVHAQLLSSDALRKVVTPKPSY